MKVHVRMGDDHSSFIAIIILLIMIGCFWYWQSYERPITNARSYPEANTSIVIFGDEYAQGMGSRRNQGITGHLEQALGTEIINLGRNGDTVYDAWNRINTVTKIKPRITIISLGSNDKNRLPAQTPSDEVRELYGRIIDELHRSGSVVVILETPGYGVLYRNLARDYQTAYVSNIFEGFWGKDAYMADSEHPNDAGYEQIANKVKPEVRRILWQ